MGRELQLILFFPSFLPSSTFSTTQRWVRQWQQEATLHRGHVEGWSQLCPFLQALGRDQGGSGPCQSITKGCGVQGRGKAGGCQPSTSCLCLPLLGLLHIQGHFQAWDPISARDPLPAAHTHVAEVPEGHELDDVTHGLLARVGAQHPAVPVQELHGGEVSIAHSHDDDGHGQLGRLHHSVSRLIHVADYPVRDDEEDEVLLWMGGGRVSGMPGHPHTADRAYGV